MVPMASLTPKTGNTTRVQPALQWVAEPPP
jgi:hypothetical protein